MTGMNAAELSVSNYAVRRKELLQLIKQLRAVGFVSLSHLLSTFPSLQFRFRAQADLDLPRITIIGNQSAGKSSVVEAISGVRTSSSTR